MRPCPRCQRSNPDEAVYCGGCGVPLEPEKAGPQGRSDAGQTRLAAPEERPKVDAGRAERVVRPVAQPGRTMVAVIALLGLAGLTAATGHKVATRPGRVLPAVNPKLRALPPPTTEEEEPPPPQPATKKTEDGPGETREAVASKTTAVDKKVAKNAVAGKATERKATEKKVVKKTAAKKTTAKKIAAVKTAPKAAPKPALGGPPDQSEIEACINSRKAKVRACADEAAQRMEAAGYGIARATLNPNGTFSDIRMNGGEYFVSCATKVISGLRCRAFQGDPVEVRYRLR